MYKVMIDCEVGIYRYCGDGWERPRHTITWASYATFDEALSVVADLNAGNPRNQAWVAV